MFSQIPRDPRALHEMADIHGGYFRLMRWGSLFYSQTPLLHAARWRTRHSHVVFITGTQGKTTLLRAVRHLHGLPVDSWTDSNTNCRGEVPWSALRMPRGTPIIPLEVPDGTADYETFAEALRPRSAVFLNVGREHVNLLGSLQAVVDQFAQLLSQLPGTGWAVVNADDPYLPSLPTSAQVITFGNNETADVRIVHASREHGRLVVELSAAGQPVTAATQLVGLHYQHVVAAYVAWAITAGLEPDFAVQRLRELPITPSRMQPFRSLRGARILSDDYKATPETVRVGLAEAGAWPGQTRWAVLGELTNHPASDADWEYLAVARAAAQAVDKVVTIGPAWQDHADVWEGLEVDVQHTESVMAAGQIVLDQHGPDDVIYVKGTEEIRVRRITLRLTGVPVACVKTECKKSLVLCENCSELT